MKHSFVIRPQAKPAIRKASRSTIEGYFVGLSNPLRESAWLDTNNRYRVNCVKRVEDDAKWARAHSAGLITKRKHSHLTAYVGASAPTHVVDGWSFLGRAIDCALRGDTYSSAHFAYYAELRAAMALLASEGIGIFSKKHAFVGHGSTAFFPTSKANAGTHAVVWPLFRYWSSLPRATELLNNLIQPEQIPLSSWLSAKKIPLSTTAVGKRWLSRWGLDLENALEDHNARNLASYRPSEFRYASSYGASGIADFVSALWKLFEPGVARRFERIERYLLRSAVRKGGGLESDEIAQVGLTELQSKEWEEFLSSEDDPLPLVLSETSSSIEDSTCHLRMISRAALLLFVASGSARNLLKNANYTSDTISFWWKKHGIDRGLWNPTNVPDDPLDAWEDITLVIDELAAWRSANTRPSVEDLRKSQHQNINELGALELIGIWSLLP
ncbi:MAG: hypothetical protein ABUS47_13695 [Steroidobacter sp.]